MKFVPIGLLLLSVLGNSHAGTLSYAEKRTLAREKGVKKRGRRLTLGGIAVAGEGEYTFSSVEDRSYGEDRNEAKKNVVDLMSNDFEDSTRGYCVMDKMKEVEELDLLFNAAVSNVEDFLDFEEEDDGTTTEEVTKDLEGFVEVVRAFLPADVSATDREILSSVMSLTTTGPDRDLSQACVAKIEEAFQVSLREFNKAMNVGSEFFIPDIEPFVDIVGDSVTNTWSYLLQILELESATTFDKFKDFILGHYEIFDARQYFDDGWKRGVRSWQEATLSGITIVAKYAVVYLTDGTVIQNAFDSLNVETMLNQLYSDTVKVCNPAAPTASPTTPSDEQENPPDEEQASDQAHAKIPLVAVIDETSSAVSAEDLESSFASLRENYPGRRLCLLQPRPADKSAIKIPPAFSSGESNAIYKTVSADNGSFNRISHWFNQCDLQDFVDQGVATVALYVSPSAASKVPSSQFYFERYLGRKGMSPIMLTGDGTTNWIAPFDRDFP